MLTNKIKGRIRCLFFSACGFHTIKGKIDIIQYMTLNIKSQ